VAFKGDVLRTAKFRAVQMSEQERMENIYIPFLLSQSDA